MLAQRLRIADVCLLTSHDFWYYDSVLFCVDEPLKPLKAGRLFSFAEVARMSERQLIGGLVLAAIICIIVLCVLVSVAMGMATEPWKGCACGACLTAVLLFNLLRYTRKRIDK